MSNDLLPAKPRVRRRKKLRTRPIQKFFTLRIPIFLQSLQVALMPNAAKHILLFTIANSGSEK